MCVYDAQNDMALLTGEAGRAGRLLAGALGLAAAALGQAGHPQAAEQEIKAAYVYNFAKFVEWPGEATGQPLQICVVGDGFFALKIQEAIQGKTANGRPLAVRLEPKPDEMRHCHILFVGALERKRLGKLLPLLEGGSVLTVGNGEDFARQGGVIGFVVDQNRVRFEINVEAAARSRLRISSQLLRVAKVTPGG